MKAPHRRAVSAAKLVQCRALVRRGLPVAEAAVRVGMAVSTARRRASAEGWIAERGAFRELACPLDLPLDREVHNRRVYELVKDGLARLETDLELAPPQFATALDTLDKVGRRVLGLGGANESATVAVLASNAVVFTGQATKEGAESPPPPEV